VEGLQQGAEQAAAPLSLRLKLKSCLNTVKGLQEQAGSIAVNMVLSTAGLMIGLTWFQMSAAASTLWKDCSKRQNQAGSSG
jgi:hypothetical protein